MKQPRSLTETGPPTSTRIEEAAVGLFFQRGYRATSVREIALACGLTPGALYNHFESKEALLATLLRGAHAGLADVLHAAVDSGGDDPAAQLRALVRAHALFHTDHRELARIANQEIGSLPEPARTEVVELRRRLRLLFNETLERGVEAGVFKVTDVRVTALAIINMGIRIVDWFRPDGELSAGGVADVHGELALRMAGVSA